MIWSGESLYIIAYGKSGQALKDELLTRDVIYWIAFDGQLFAHHGFGLHGRLVVVEDGLRVVIIAYHPLPCLSTQTIRT